MSNFVVQSNVHLNDIKGKITTLATDIGAAHILVTKDTFTHHANPTITVADGSPVNKEFHVVGGVDNSDGTFSNINPIKVSDSGNLSVVSTQITSGQDSKAVGEGLQQVLVYGRHSDGRLFPLESDGDRLRVSNGDLSTGAQHSGGNLTQAKLVQVVGTTGTQMRTLKTDDVGQLKISNSKNEFVEVQGVSHPIGANTASSIEINAEGYGKLRITIHSSSTDELLIEGSSTSGGTYMVFSSLYPSNIAIDNSGNTANMATILIDCPPSYLRLRNKGPAEITLEKYIFTSMVN